MKVASLLHPSNLSNAHIKYWSSVLLTQDITLICNTICENIINELNEPVFIGSGNESVVFQDIKKIKKFLISWPIIRSPIDITYSNLKHVSQRIPINSNHFYSFEVKKISDHIILISYDHEMSKEVTQINLEKEWHNRWRKCYIDVFNEADKLGITVLDPKIKNFRLINDKLKFIDYGRDILIKEAGWIEINRMFSMYKNRIYNLGPSKLDYKID